MLLGYVRVSTADQAKDGRTSLQTQTDIIEGVARVRGVDRWDVQIYDDAGVSGAVKLACRPAGERLLADMKAGDVVVASKLDRMFRSAADALNMLEVFQERGVDLILYDMGAEPLAKGNYLGKLVMTILAAVGDMERVRIKERTADGRRAKKARGGIIGKVPFGFAKSGEGRTAIMVPNEAEQKAEARMRELAADRRASYRTISAQLAAEGILSRTGRPYSPEVIRQRVLQQAE